MASVVVKSDFTLNTQQLLNSLAQLNTAELEDFYECVGRLLKSRSGESSISSLFSITDSSADEANLPIVEKLIPRSITLDGDSIRF